MDKRKQFTQSRRHEEKAGSFRCSHCATPVPVNPEMGTSHRNHCNCCLWSKHVDEHTGDRQATCQAGMAPIGLTLKKEGADKFTGREKLGDVMIVHRCTNCHKVNINRIAADDSTEQLMEVFAASAHMSPKLRCDVKEQGIELLDESRRGLLMQRLLGEQAE